VSNFGSEICRRLAEVRLKHFGPRGKARFARDLGIRPSSYTHYELDRTPPAELLVLATRLTGTNLEWLLTGEGEMQRKPSAEVDSLAVPLLARLQNLLARNPELSRSVTGFLDLLDDVAETFPKVEQNAENDEHFVGQLIPIIGSTAAGPTHFWEELSDTGVGREIDSRLEEMLNQYSQQAVRNAMFVKKSLPEAETSNRVSLVQFSRPDEQGFIEFLSCPAVKTKYPDAVSWRIDGESMRPRLNDGDLVITSPGQPAVDGEPCIVRLKGQIGVTCKIFRRDGDDVLLIPVNDANSMQRFKKADLLWTRRVLYSIRLTSHQ
jgi:SOS-response transcriptional repressor LexA